MSAKDTGRPRCFVAMPITTRRAEADLYGDDEHWDHVYETLFAPAITRAGMEPVKPVSEGSHMIHAEIVKNLSLCDLVLVDLSSHNPNVFFEFGVRVALNLPVSVIRDEMTDIPFDTSGINTHRYASGIQSWRIEREIEQLKSHLSRSVDSCRGQNPLWRQFGLSLKAASATLATESVGDARLDLLVDRMDQIHSRLDSMGPGLSDTPPGSRTSRKSAGAANVDASRTLEEMVAELQAQVVHLTSDDAGEADSRDVARESPDSVPSRAAAELCEAIRATRLPSLKGFRVGNDTVEVLTSRMISPLYEDRIDQLARRFGVRVTYRVAKD